MVAPALLSSKTDNWATPQTLFDKLNATFHFTLDPCASPENAKCERYFTKEQDGLAQDWGGGHYLVQPTLWARDWQMGQKMCRTSRNCSYVDSSKDRHKMVASIYRQQSNRHREIFERSIEIRWSEKCSSVSERTCDIFQHYFR